MHWSRSWSDSGCSGRNPSLLIRLDVISDQVFAIFLRELMSLRVRINLFLVLFLLSDSSRNTIGNRQVTM